MHEKNCALCSAYVVNIINIFDCACAEHNLHMTTILFSWSPTCLERSLTSFKDLINEKADISFVIETNLFLLFCTSHYVLSFEKFFFHILGNDITFTFSLAFSANFIMRK